jgi:hypothetical protein
MRSGVTKQPGMLQGTAVPPAPDREALQDRGQGRADAALRDPFRTLDHESWRGFQWRLPEERPEPSTCMRHVRC